MCNHKLREHKPHHLHFMEQEAQCRTGQHMPGNGSDGACMTPLWKRLKHPYPDQFTLYLTQLSNVGLRALFKAPVLWSLDLNSQPFKQSIILTIELPPSLFPSLLPSLAQDTTVDPLSIGMGPAQICLQKAGDVKTALNASGSDVPFVSDHAAIHQPGSVM